jgi:hypothetical protein
MQSILLRTHVVIYLRRNSHLRRLQLPCIHHICMSHIQAASSCTPGMTAESKFKDAHCAHRMFKMTINRLSLLFPLHYLSKVKIQCSKEGAAVLWLICMMGGRLGCLASPRLGCARSQQHPLCFGVVMVGMANWMQWVSTVVIGRYLYDSPMHELFIPGAIPHADGKGCAATCFVVA